MLPDSPGTKAVDRHYIFHNWEQFEQAPETLVRAIATEEQQPVYYDRPPNPVTVSLGIVDTFLTLRGMDTLVLLGDFFASLGTEVLPKRIVLSQDWCTNVIQPWGNTLLIWEDPVVLRKFFDWTLAATFYSSDPQIKRGYRLWKIAWLAIRYTQGKERYLILASGVRCAYRGIYLAAEGKTFTATSSDMEPLKRLEDIEDAVIQGSLTPDTLGVRRFRSVEEYNLYIRRAMEEAAKSEDKRLNPEVIETITGSDTDQLWKRAMKKFNLRSVTESGLET